MSLNSPIEWTDATWNPWHGCHKVSPGCKLCYMFREKKQYGQDPNAVVRSKTTFNAPLKWKDPALVFTCSWSDWFIEEADAWRDEAYDIIRRTPHLTYQILTKRPERMAGRVPNPPLPNIWFGVSVESQQYADERMIPLLLQTPAAVRFISAEPLLGPVDLARVNYTMHLRDSLVKLARWHAEREGEDSEVAARRAAASVTDQGIPDCEKPNLNALTGEWFDGWDSGDDGAKLDWVIVGGESGSGARPMHPEWARSLRDQCVAAGVPFFFKQWGEWQDGSAEDPSRDRIVLNDGRAYHRISGEVDVETLRRWPEFAANMMARVGKKAAGRLLDGREWNEMPEVRSA